MSSNKWFVLAAVIALAACQLDIHKVKMQGVQRHANGLLMPLPEGFTATTLPDGFEVKQSGVLRSPLEFRVRLTHGPLPPHASRKYLGLFGAYEYVLADSDAGSSGTAYVLWTWRAIGRCWIELSADQTMEFGEPNFLPARATTELTSVENDSEC